MQRTRPKTSVFALVYNVHVCAVNLHKTFVPTLAVKSELCTKNAWIGCFKQLRPSNYVHISPTSL